MVHICDKRKSVLDAKSHCLVVGGPGCGKTTLAILKAIRRIEQGMASGQDVLFLSFSRAAVAQISNTAEDLIPLDKRPSLSIETFHSFFWQILRGHGYLLGSPRRLSILLPQDERALSNGIARYEPGWENWKKTRLSMFYDQGRIAFDLFAPLTRELLTRAKRIRNRVAARYPLILVDEAQDTSDEQWECLELLAERAQVVCLADPNQMIYDFLPGVGPRRIAEIRKALVLHEIDLETQNHRSPGTEIAVFARDILTSTVRGAPYNGVSRHRFNSRADSRDSAIRQSVGILIKRIQDATGQRPTSIALIASYGRGVAVISQALQRGKHIRHQVLFDEAFALLCSRAAAFLMEPKDAAQHSDDVATLLELVESAFRAKGTKTSLTLSKKCRKYAGQCRAGNVPKWKIVQAASSLVASSRDRKFTGSPANDWTAVKREMKSLGDDSFQSMASSLDYLVAFARGQRISESLSSLWLEHGNYTGAREVLDGALAQDQLLSSREQTQGIYVLNMHKCKGKQFDGVVLYRQQHHSPFVWRQETSPQSSSRRLLHMAITRARSHVLILDEAASECPIINPYVL
jgi:DNA helicase II / ATP-dependent DNA helicase PcrA